MTLMELLITSVLVGIVTIGLIAAEQVVRMSRQSSARDNQVTTQLQAAMTLLTADANLTVGDANDTGIYQYKNGIKRQMICFRYSSGDVNTYADDLLNCWSSNDTTKELWSCRGLVSTVQDCTLSANKLYWGKLSNSEFFGVYDSSGTLFADSNFSRPGGGLVGSVGYIEINLQSRYSLTQAAHPINNPDYNLRTQISPVGLSR